MAVVRLPKTGPIVLTSDVCYLMQNLQKDILPSVALAYNPAGMLDGYAYLRARCRDLQKAQTIAGILRIG
jgi:N-acyl homoserine lactone hydrolase